MSAEQAGVTTKQDDDKGSVSPFIIAGIVAGALVGLLLLYLGIKKMVSLLPPSH